MMGPGSMMIKSSMTKKVRAFVKNTFKKTSTMKTGKTTQRTKSREKTCLRIWSKIIGDRMN